MSLVSELKRRNVFKVGAAYAVVAWVAMQVVDIVLPTFDAPRWVNQTLLFLIILGFPVALVLAWAFELTPDGIKVTKDIDPQFSTRPQTGHKLNYLIVGGLVALLGIVMLDAYVLDGEPEVAQALAVESEAEQVAPPVGAEPAAVAAEEKSLVVLPFTNLSDDPDQEYFSDGMTEELINTLSRVDDLLVTGRTSAFFYKDSALPLMDIGEALNVNHVLQGSVRKSGTQLRIAVTLTEAASGFNLWTGTYDRELNDIFAVQDEIAAAVTDALSITLGAGAFARADMTRNVEAYDEYLQANAAMIVSSAESLQQAIVHAERAVALDNEFVLGWLMVGRAYGLANSMLSRTETVGYPDKRDAANSTAVALAPESEAGLAAKAMQALNRREWAAAEQLLQQRLTLHGETPDALNAMSGFLNTVGRSHESLRYRRRLERVDPLFATGNVGQAMLAAGVPLPEIEASFDAVPESLREAGYFAHLAFVYMLKQDWDAALAATARTESVRVVQTRLLEHVKAGRVDEGLADIREQMEDPNLANALRAKHLPWMAIVFGDDALAIGLSSERAVDFTYWTDHWSKARATPAFKQKMQTNGLLDYWRSTGNWADDCRPVNDDFECF
jgi:TolB-like protein